MEGKMIVIVGPTAIGKSTVALRLASTLGGEIVSADSRQVYRYMDIGTAKPTREERGLVPHHLIDIVNPDEDFSLALYLNLALKAAKEVHHKGRLPFLVGGTGQYVRGILEGWQVPRVPPNLSLRQEFQTRAEDEGVESLHRELMTVDPRSARKIDPRNVRRVIRALEVWKTTGMPFSSFQSKVPLPFQTLIIGLTTERAKLYKKIDARVDRMVEQGWAEEVKGLMEMGYGPGLPSMSSLGYRELSMYIQGKLDLPSAVERIKFESHRFARHQYAWFRPDVLPGVHWFDVVDGPESKIEALVREWALESVHS
ncbi:MAG: tRNA (adenosine(37)-N6)-dimethylallyltransferase MiaA [Chloroflexi bacterium]|nr:tRNA (adenosine(37)-N6)-dimethylallyltransferase MiaA [Chloroflexota bacterium]